jgi:Sulfotransferase family
MLSNTVSMNTVPNFLIVGAARSGTTGLVEGLRSHPHVYVTEPKEPHYFALHGQTPHFAGPGDAHTINKVAITDRDSYLALYPERHDFLAMGDGSVSTMYYHERALPEVVEINPDMRLVVLLREPIARAYSSHQYMRARGFEPHEDFLQAVDEEPARKAANYHHLWHYTSMSMYADAIEALQKTVPAERLGVWFYDDLDRDYEGTVRDVLRFLDVPPAEGEAEGVPRVNISGQPRLASVHKALQWATRHDALRRGVKRMTSYRFRERIRRLTLRSGGVPADAVERLRPVFADDLARLRELLPGDGTPDWLREA